MAGYFPIFADGDRLLIFLRVFLRFAVPWPYPETIYCVPILLARIALRKLTRTTSSPSTLVDVARESIPIDDLRLIIREIIRPWNWGVRNGALISSGVHLCK